MSTPRATTSPLSSTGPRGLQLPALAQQGGARTTFRVLGVVLVLGGLALLGTALADFFASFSSPGRGMPTKFWMAFVGIPVLAVGIWAVMAGFMGTASRYVAGETLPVVKDGLGYLTQGHGIAGLGRIADATPTDRATAARYCTECGAALSGTALSGTARFCSGCGHAVS